MVLKKSTAILQIIFDFYSWIVKESKKIPDRCAGNKKRSLRAPFMAVF
jgi:hypothetical protein